MYCNLEVVIIEKTQIFKLQIFDEVFGTLNSDRKRIVLRIILNYLETENVVLGF